LAGSKPHSYSIDVCKRCNEPLGMNDYFIKEVDFDNDWYSLSKDSFDVTPTFDEFKENLTQANARNFGFFLNEKMIGTFTLSQNLDNVLSKCYEINNVSIDSKLRNNGLGKIMFNSLFNLFNDCNFSLNTTSASDFYKKLGMDVLYEKDGVSYFYHNRTFLKNT
jgi:predicted acetyltransferase